MTSPLARQKDYSHVSPSTVEADVPPLLSDGRGVAPASPDCQQCRQPDAGRSKQVAEIAENAGIDGNEVLEGSPLIGKSLAETAETPCKYFAYRSRGRSFAMRKAISIGLLAIGVLSGCSDQVWVKAGMTQAEYQKDSYECGQSAGMSTGSYGSSLDAAQQAKTAKSRCMTARGYTLQKADSVDPALKLVNCKFKEVDQVQRLSAQSCTSSGGTVVDDAD